VGPGLGRSNGAGNAEEPVLVGELAGSSAHKAEKEIVSSKTIGNGFMERYFNDSGIRSKSLFARACVRNGIDGVTRERSVDTVKYAIVLVLAWIVLGASLPVQAKFVGYETTQVPIDRLFKNLEDRLARETNNFEAAYDLARLHSMAYSTNLVMFATRTKDNRPEFYSPGNDSGVPSGVFLPASAAPRAGALDHLTNAIRLYERAILLLKKSSNDVPNREWLVLPMELGYAWCLDQAGSRDRALTAYRKVLADAWKKEMTGEFNFTEWAAERSDGTISVSNPLQSTPRRGVIGPGICFGQETISYILALLDPSKDAKEIADLREKQAILKRTPRAITPILIPLVDNAAFRELVDPSARVSFDLDGTGLPRQWQWITPKAAWLIFDRFGEKQISSALQMFGNCTFWIFWSNGYDPLRALDDDQNGVLQGAELSGVALWHDRNSNGKCDPGEVKPVTEWGIVRISCKSEIDASGMSWSRTGVTFRDGTTRPSYDWIAHSSSDD